MLLMYFINVLLVQWQEDLKKKWSGIGYLNAYSLKFIELLNLLFNLLQTLSQLLQLLKYTHEYW